MQVHKLLWRFVLCTLLWSIPAVACWQVDRPSSVVHGDYVQGHVLRNGKPLRHSKVMLRGSSQRSQAEGITDTDGRFILRRVPPGKYRLQIGISGDADIEFRPADVNVGIAF